MIILYYDQKEFSYKNTHIIVKLFPCYNILKSNQAKHEMYHMESYNTQIYHGGLRMVHVGRGGA